MITVKRRKWGKHYRVAVYVDGRLIATTKWSPKEGKTVKQIEKELKHNPPRALTKFAPKSRQKLIMVLAPTIAKKRTKELKDIIQNAKSVFVDWIFKDHFTTTDPRKNKETVISYQVSFTTFGSKNFYLQNHYTLLDEFTELLREATKDFIEEALSGLSHLTRKVTGSCSVEGEDWRVGTSRRKIELWKISAEFKVVKSYGTYDYSIDYEGFIRERLEDKITEMELWW